MDAGEEEYESDPEQAKLSLKMRRRREASDDEEEEDDARGRERRIDYRVSDCESDGQGAASEYYGDEKSDLEEEPLEEVEEEEEFGEHRGGSDAQGMVDDASAIERSSFGKKKEDEKTDADGFNSHENFDEIGDNVNGIGGEEGPEEKKENEPFAVPTAGAFYMHDDRFRDAVGGRHRRTRGERTLWESRDDTKWGHDKFEEMSVQERHYDGGRRVSRGNRPRGRKKGEDYEYSQGNRPKAHDNNYQNSAPKSVRGKGPRRYRPSFESKVEAPAYNRRPSKSLEKVSNANSGRTSATTSTSESAQVPSSKNVFESSLNSASPPFYPSGPSNKHNIESTLEKDVQTGHVNRDIHPSVSGENYPNSRSNNMRGKSLSDSLDMDKLSMDDSNSVTTYQVRNKRRGQTPLGKMVYQPTPPHNNQANRVPLPNQNHGFQQTFSGSNVVESTESASSLESNDSKMALVGKGNGGIQSNGMTSFPYGGAQVMATSSGIGSNHGDQNFPGTPTFLPVMQFGGQQRGRMGVPAVGMAFPGYVGQPNGMGNSEMTWLPVLAGSAGGLGAPGALGATYRPPYITIDGAYHARTSDQTFSLTPASTKDRNIHEPGNKVKPLQGSELANDESGQRQNKARRYTEMKFDQ